MPSAVATPGGASPAPRRVTNQFSRRRSLWLGWPCRMYARLTTTVLAPDEHDAAAEVFPQVLPTLKALDGFKGIVVASEDEGKRIIALSFWESAEALEASRSTMDRMRDAESGGRNIESQESIAFRVVGFELDR
jgi:heme-degrading monooxygenase HmoA